MDKPEYIEAKAWNCGEYPERLRSMVDAANEVADRLDMSTEQIIAWAILSAQSQAYDDAARIARNDFKVMRHGNPHNSWGDRVSLAILARKEELNGH